MSEEIAAPGGHLSFPAVQAESLSLPGLTHGDRLNTTPPGVLGDAVVGRTRTQT